MLRFRIDKTAKSGSLVKFNRCNLSCIWCHHDYFIGKGFHAIKNVQFCEIIKKILDAVGDSEALVRIAGNGEPTCVGANELGDLIYRLKEIDKVNHISLTTNGVFFGSMASELKEKGLNDVSISLNSLSRDRYKEYTKQDCLHAVLLSINESIKNGIPTKINTLYTKFTHEEIDHFDKLSSEYNGMIIRFSSIITQNKSQAANLFAPTSDLERILSERAISVYEKTHPYPARIYTTKTGGKFEVTIPSLLNNCKNTSCKYSKACLEGCRYATRIGIDGVMKPCSIREDNMLKMTDNSITTSDILSSLKSGGKL